MVTKFPLSVSYGQVVVYTANLERPGLLWDDDHLAQGFAWDNGIVSFAVPDHDGASLVEVNSLEKQRPPIDRALWAVEVPFEVTSGNIEVGTIMMMRTVHVPIGKYSLIFQSLPGRKVDNADFTFVFELTFLPNDKADFKILKTGDVLTTDRVLRKDAKRA